MKFVKKIRNIILLSILLASIFWMQTHEETIIVNLESVPEFSGDSYVVLDGNEPRFTEEELTIEPYERYSELDELGRCGVAMACIGKSIMPETEREDISEVLPSGWQWVKYNNIEGKYLYNRCHLIGFQLAGENANELNLITGTRYLNIDGMLGHENMIAEYVKDTGNHVLYRVTPLYRNDNLVASGVLMEGYSVEDKGEGIQFCIYAYNVQPGVGIDYATGDSWLEETAAGDGEEITAVLNVNTKEFVGVLNEQWPAFFSGMPEYPLFTKDVIKSYIITTLYYSNSDTL